MPDRDGHRTAEYRRTTDDVVHRTTMTDYGFSGRFHEPTAGATICEPIGPGPVQESGGFTLIMD